MFNFGTARKHAGICDPKDAVCLTKLVGVLKDLGGSVVDHHESDLGVTHWRYRVGRAEVEVYADPTSVDIEGPAKLVEQIMTLLRKPTPAAG